MYTALIRFQTKVMHIVWCRLSKRSLSRQVQWNALVLLTRQLLHLHLGRAVPPGKALPCQLTLHKSLWWLSQSAAPLQLLHLSNLRQLPLQRHLHRQLLPSPSGMHLSGKWTIQCLYLKLRFAMVTTTLQEAVRRDSFVRSRCLHLTVA